MTQHKNLDSRRQFLVKMSIGAGVMFGFSFAGCGPIRRAALGMVEEMTPAYSGEGTEANLWFEILKNNKIVFHSPKVEMGQGTFTGMAQIIADELDVSIDQIDVIGAATETGVVDAMSTGGSLSIAGIFTPLREMSATIREMVKAEAATKWGVNAADLKTDKGIISGAGKTMTYADAVADVKEWKIPETPALRPVSSYKYVGKPITRIDLEPKVFGEPIFGMDAEMPDMLHACVIRSEHIGSTFKSADTDAAEKMPGIVKIVKDKDFVGVVAESYSQALAAKRKIKVDWDIPKKWTEEGIREILQVGKGDSLKTQKIGSALDPDDDDVVSLEFTSPIGAHAQIEPNGVVASVKDGKATIIISTQVIGVTQNQVSDALGLDKENVNVIPTYLGGGFGRRLNTNHAILAAKMSKEVGKPVKYFFTRKEEFQNDTFRPPTHHILRGKLAADGMFEGLEHHYASGDVAINSVILPPMVSTALGTDVGAMRGGNIMYDKIPNQTTVQWHTTLPFATSWWRSLGLLANTFAIESFIDEMAIKAGKNPVDYRLSQLSDEGNSKRIADVISKVAKMSNYSDNVSNGRAMGIAASIDAGAPAAHVAEVSIVGNEIKVHKVFCAFDCGIVVNPDQVKAQCEGSIIMGLSAALHERMTIKDGRLFPIIYGPYDMALMKHTPKVLEIELIQGKDIPLGVGEPPMGPIAAAINNAVRRLTNKRLTELPLKITNA